MTMDTRYKLIDLIEKEYTIFIKGLDGLDDSCFEIKMGDKEKSPKEILIEQIDLMTTCISQKEVNRKEDDVDYSYEELKYIFNLMYLNLLTWVENLSDDSKILEEDREGNFNSIAGWFDEFLISELKIHNIEIKKWKENYRKNKKDL